MASITLIVALASALTGQPCAAIDNMTNQHAWKAPGMAQVRAGHYADRGDRLIYRPAPGPRANGQWRALHAAEESLQVGAPGPKFRLACES